MWLFCVSNLMVFQTALYSFGDYLSGHAKQPHRNFTKKFITKLTTLQKKAWQRDHRRPMLWPGVSKPGGMGGYIPPIL